MIGNNVSSRLPWRTAPGSRWRKELAKLFYKKLGNRFAVFGHGWKADYGKGPLPFDEQVNAYHSSRMGIGVNNALGARYYFSNRLPIALSSGVPFVHNYEAGYEEIFKPIEDFCFFRTTSEAWELTKQLLEKDQNELDKIGAKGYDFSRNRLTATEAMRYMIRVLNEHRQARNEGGKIDITGNPWINSPKL
jgi:spore maturation protein CgeB